jgi:two-component system, sensor histidine kinase LadS
LQRAPGSDTSWFLEVAYPPLDAVELYWRATDGSGFTQILTGDSRPFDSRPVHEPGFFLPLDLADAQPREFLLRVQSAGAVTVPLAVLSAQALDRERGHGHLPAGLFFGLLIALAAYNLLLYVSIRDAGYLLYVAFVASAGLAFFGYNGLAFQYLWPEAVAWNQRAHLVFSFLALGFAALFTRRFLDLSRHSRRLDRSLLALAAGAALLALLSVWPLSFATSVRLFVALAIPAVLVVFAGGVVALRRGDRPARWFLLAWATLLVGLLAYALRFIDLLPANLFTLYGVQIGSGIEALLLSIALADRINIMKRDKEAAQAQALAASQRSEKELETLVQQRVAELNQLNLLLQEEITERRRAEEALFEQAHHDSLTGLPNRLLLKDRFELAIAQAGRNDSLLALLMLDLDGFKRINDTLGHDVGDQVLVEFADILRSTVRSTDTVARLGGDEFVVLLGSLRDADEAVRVTGKILKALAAAAQLGEPASDVTASIGVALHPQDGANLDALLKYADKAMYRAKDAGGNRYFFHLSGDQRQLSLPEAG